MKKIEIDYKFLIYKMKSMIRTASFRTKCICNSNVKDKTVFQTLPNVNVTINDIEHMKYATISMKHDEKIDYYYTNGINYENVCKYYDYVVKLNDLVKPQNKNEFWNDIRIRLAFMYSFVFNEI